MASKRRIRRKAARLCPKKRAFPNRETAVSELNRYRGRDTFVEDGQLHAYHCPACGKWHHGHVEGRNHRG